MVPRNLLFWRLKIKDKSDFSQSLIDKVRKSVQLTIAVCSRLTRSCNIFNGLIDRCEGIIAPKDFCC